MLLALRALSGLATTWGGRGRSRGTVVSSVCQVRRLLPLSPVSSSPPLLLSITVYTPPVAVVISPFCGAFWLSVSNVRARGVMFFFTAICGVRGFRVAGLS